MIPRSPQPWFRRLREKWGFKPEGFDPDLAAAAMSGGCMLALVAGAIVMAALSGHWVTMLLAFVAGWIARSVLPTFKD